MDCTIKKQIENVHSFASTIRRLSWRSLTLPYKGKRHCSMPMWIFPWKFAAAIVRTNGDHRAGFSIILKLHFSQQRTTLGFSDPVNLTHTHDAQRTPIATTDPILIYFRRDTSAISIIPFGLLLPFVIQLINTSRVWWSIFVSTIHAMPSTKWREWALGLVAEPPPHFWLPMHPCRTNVCWACVNAWCIILLIFFFWLCSAHSPLPWSN